MPLLYFAISDRLLIAIGSGSPEKPFAQGDDGVVLENAIQDEEGGKESDRA